MKASERKIVSAFTLVGTLAFYYYSKHQHKDSVPCTLLGGFLGAWIGETIAQSISNSKNKNNNGNPQ